MTRTLLLTSSIIAYHQRCHFQNHHEEIKEFKEESGLPTHLLPTRSIPSRHSQAAQTQPKPEALNNDPPCFNVYLVGQKSMHTHVV